jgi:hypothetical protein
MNDFLKKFLSENLMKHIPEIKSVTFSDKESQKKAESSDNIPANPAKAEEMK